MKKFLLTIVSAAAVIAVACASSAQPPDRGRRQGPPPDDQSSDYRRDRPGDGARGGDRPRWRLGSIIPPPIQDQLQLSDEQQQQLHDLEKEVKERVLKLLSEDQKQKLQELRQRGPARAPRRGRDGDDDRQGPGDDRQRRNRPDDGPDRRDPPGEANSTSSRMTSVSGIQWFASLESGLREAQRSGRPILLVSAAPHCAGIPGVW